MRIDSYIAPQLIHFSAFLHVISRYKNYHRRSRVCKSKLLPFDPSALGRAQFLSPNSEYAISRAIDSARGRSRSVAGLRGNAGAKEERQWGRPARYRGPFLFDCAVLIIRADKALIAF